MTDDRAVLGRAVAILSAFAAPGSGAMTLTEIVARTGLPMTTAHRLSRQLVDERLLERLADGRYRVGLRLWELGTLAPRSQTLRDVALPFLEDLFEITREHVQLMVLDGLDAVVVERLSGAGAVKLEGRAGGRLPVHATSGGIAMLAARSDERAVAAVLARGLQRFTDGTPHSEAALRSAIATVRSHGYIELRDAVTPGSVSIAAPIALRDPWDVAAVSVVVRSESDTRMLPPAIRMTAKAIARAMHGVATTGARA